MFEVEQSSSCRDIFFTSFNNTSCICPRLTPSDTVNFMSLSRTNTRRVVERSEKYVPTFRGNRIMIHPHNRIGLAVMTHPLLLYDVLFADNLVCHCLAIGVSCLADAYAVCRLFYLASVEGVIFNL